MGRLEMQPSEVSLAPLPLSPSGRRLGSMATPPSGRPIRAGDLRFGLGGTQSVANPRAAGSVHLAGPVDLGP
jgi:hypothetical protein